jgi:hypothetical protein
MGEFRVETLLSGCSPVWSAFLCQGCIVVGVLLMLASTIGGLRSIIQDASTFQFYS